jgi:nucleoid-associated protein YgaU
MHANVTREHKLALIIGFSLVLVVGVLISDHFSKARSQPLASEITPGNAERFGADTRGMRVVSASAPGPTILTPPPGASTPPGLLPPSSDPTVVPVSGGSVDLVMGEKLAPAGAGSESLVQKVIGAGNGTALANSPQTVIPNTEPSPGGVRQLDPATGAPIPLPGPQGGSPVVTPVGGNPGTIPPAVSPRVEPAKEELVNGVPRNMMKRHDVREGESAYRIAQEAYGDGKLWNKLAEYNKGKMNANGSMREGVTLLLPPKEALLGKPLPAAPAADAAPATTPGKTTPGKVDPRADTKTAAKPEVKPDVKLAKTEPKPEAKAEKAAPKTYTVQKGDSLSDIARKTLGSSKRWSEIVEMNKDVLDDEDTLVVGKTLKLPSR